ncbi:hypothetical protein ACNKHT_14100 [Shigella flexneri]
MHPGRDCSDGKGRRPCRRAVQRHHELHSQNADSKTAWLAVRCTTPPASGYLIKPDGIETGDVRRSGREQWPLLWAHRLRRAGVFGQGYPTNTKVGITIDTDWFWG